MNYSEYITNSTNYANQAKSMNKVYHILLKA